MSTEAPTGAVATQPQDDFQWISPEEAEKMEKMLYKNFVRRDPKYPDKPERDAKNFFYKVENWHPFSPVNRTPNTMEFLMAFEVQKYYRDEYVDATILSPGGDKLTERRNKRVMKHDFTTDPVTVLDKDADFHIDARDFAKQFMRDPFDS